MIEAYLKYQPQADVIRLDGIGHWPQIEAPDRVVQEILKFTGQIDLASRAGSELQGLAVANA